MAASYDFVQLDVFTGTPLAGIPLVVLTIRGGGYAVELLRGTVTL